MLRTPGISRIAPMPDFETVLEFNQDSGLVPIQSPVVVTTTIVQSYTPPLQSYFVLDEILVIVTTFPNLNPPTVNWTLLVDGVAIYPWVKQVPHGTFTAPRAVGVTPLLTIEGGRLIQIQITIGPGSTADNAVTRIAGRLLRPATPSVRSKIRSEIFR
jgi:hypothetical protein